MNNPTGVIEPVIGMLERWANKTCPKGVPVGATELHLMAANVMALIQAYRHAQLGYGRGRSDAFRELQQMAAANQGIYDADTNTILSSEEMETRIKDAMEADAAEDGPRLTEEQFKEWLSLRDSGAVAAGSLESWHNEKTIISQAIMIFDEGDEGSFAIEEFGKGRMLVKHTEDVAKPMVACDHPDAMKVLAAAMQLLSSPEYRVVRMSTPITRRYTIDP